MIYTSYKQKQRIILNGFSTAIHQYNESFEQAPTVDTQVEGGMMAKRIIQLSDRQGIPLQKDPNLITDLMDMDFADSIPPQLHSLMGEILLMLQELEKNT